MPIVILWVIVLCIMGHYQLILIIVLGGLCILCLALAIKWAL